MVDRARRMSCLFAPTHCAVAAENGCKLQAVARGWELRRLSADITIYVTDRPLLRRRFDAVDFSDLTRRYQGSILLARVWPFRWRLVVA